MALDKLWELLGEEKKEEVPVVKEESKKEEKKEELQTVKQETQVREEVQKEEKKLEAQNLLEEEPVPAKEVFLIFGDKGTGKTVTAMSFPGEVLVLSFDRKSAIIKSTFYNGDKRIHVFDVVKYMDYSAPEKMVETADKTFTYINYVLDNYTSHYPQPDWVVVDGAQIFQQICEWTMRYRHNIGPFDGISNLNLWKERRMYIRQIHNKALNLAKKGVIYTTYVEKDETIVRGEVVNKKDVPAWIDVLIYETDYVMQTYVENDRFKVKVVSSKNPRKVPPGEYDVTNRNFFESLRSRGGGL